MEKTPVRGNVSLEAGDGDIDDKGNGLKDEQAMPFDCSNSNAESNGAQEPAITSLTENTFTESIWSRH